MRSSDWQIRDTERLITGNRALLGEKHLLVAMTRIRNEALILPDTLDYLGNQVDAIIAYDDASTDETVEILRAHPKVALIVANQAWEQDIDARKLAEGRHRGLLLDMARAELPHDWMLCFDPDERVTEDLRGFVQGPGAEDCDSVKVQLFDAYMTQRGQRALSLRTSATRLSPLLWAGAARHSDAVAQPAGDQFRRARPRTCRAWPGQGRSLLPALRQGALGGSLGGDLRLLHPPLSVRDLRQEMDRAQREGRSTSSRTSIARSMHGARRCSRTPCR